MVRRIVHHRLILFLVIVVLSANTLISRIFIVRYVRPTPASTHNHGQPTALSRFLTRLEHPPHPTRRDRSLISSTLTLTFSIRSTIPVRPRLFMDLRSGRWWTRLVHIYIP